MNTITLQVEPSTTIHALKIIVLRQIGYDIDPDDCDVLLNNTILTNDSTLSDNNIQDSMTMEIILDNDDGNDPRLNNICNGHV